MLSFETSTDRTGHAGYYLPKVKIKEYNVLIDGKDLFLQLVKICIKSYESIRKEILLLVKKMMTQLVGYLISLISKDDDCNRFK